MSNDDESEYSLTSTIDILAVLKKLALSNKGIKIKIADTFKLYQSKIVSVDLDSLSFNIERLSPEQGNQTISAGKRFFIETDYDGIKISFRVNNRMSYQPQYKQYRVEFPSEITYLQRRACYRVETPKNEIHIHLGTSANSRLASGRIVNLSSTGIKARFELAQDKVLKAISKYPNSRLSFSDGQVLNLSLKRHHVEYHHRQISYGFRIIDISPMEQRHLDQLIQQLQWQQNQEKDRSLLTQPDGV